MKKYISKKICLPVGKFGAFKICVSGAAAGSCTIDAKDKAKEIGRAIAKEGAVLMTGATTGIPYFAAQGMKEIGGLSVGLSPAATVKEHVNKYRLPTENFDLIIYTGTGYAGRNLLLTRASDAVIIVCGRIGTLNEFTIAFEDKKIIGVLVGSGGITNELPDILNVSNRGTGHIIYDTSPDRLVKKIIAAITKSYKKDGLKPVRQRDIY